MYKININSDSDETLEDSLQKIKAIHDHTNFCSATGSIHSDRVWLTIMRGKSVRYIQGEWDSSKESLPCKVLDEKMAPLGTFNFHPRSHIGELDIKKFKESIKSIL